MTGVPINKLSSRENFIELEIYFCNTNMGRPTPRHSPTKRNRLVLHHPTMRLPCSIDGSPSSLIATPGTCNHSDDIPPNSPVHGRNLCEWSSIIQLQEQTAGHPFTSKRSGNCQLIVLSSYDPFLCAMKK